MLKLNRKDFINALRAVIVTAAKRDVRYYLHSVLIEVRPEKVVLVSTDGHRLTFATLTLNTGIEDAAVDLLLHREDAERLIKTVSVNRKSTTEEITIGWYKNEVHIGADGTQMVVTQLDGKFPEWRRIIQSTLNLDPARAGIQEYGIDTKYMADAQKAFKHLYASSKSTGVLMEFQAASDLVLLTPDKIASCGQLTEVKMGIMPMRLDK